MAALGFHSSSIIPKMTPPSILPPSSPNLSLLKPYKDCLFFGHQPFSSTISTNGLLNIIIIFCLWQLKLKVISIRLLYIYCKHILLQEVTMFIVFSTVHSLKFHHSKHKIPHVPWRHYQILKLNPHHHHHHLKKQPASPRNLLSTLTKLSTTVYQMAR